MAAIVACYDAPQPSCGFRCGPQGACPESYTCGTNNRCVLDGTSPTACGGAVVDAGADASDAEPIDAKVFLDAPLDAFESVITVTCPGTPDATVITQNNMYVPMQTNIDLGEIVQFTLEAQHDVVPAVGSDPGLQVGLGQTRCLQFNVPGTYNFLCGPHGFTGSVVVRGGP